MEELRDSSHSIHHTALKFSEEVKQMKIYNNLYKTVQVIFCVHGHMSKFSFSFRSICKRKRKIGNISLLLSYSFYCLNLQKLACSPEVCKDDMKTTLEQAMKKHGLETEIRNIVFHLIRNSIKNDIKFSMQTVS
jgi:hypothetical protein